MSLRLSILIGHAYSAPNGHRPGCRRESFARSNAVCRRGGIRGKEVCLVLGPAPVERGRVLWDPGRHTLGVEQVKEEEKSALDYNRWANECSANADSASKKIFESLVDDEERHYDQYDLEM